MSIPSQNQLQGVVKFGVSAADVDVSNDVFSCRIVHKSDGIERPGTFGSGLKTIVAGNYSKEIQIDYASVGTNAQTTLDGLIWNATWAATPSTLLFFSFTVATVAGGVTTNRTVTGTCSVLDSSMGGEVGSLRKESATFPVLTWNQTPSI